METRSRIVICGDSEYDVTRWVALADEFNFELEFIPEISHLNQVEYGDRISSVFVNLGNALAASPEEVARQVRHFAPNARLIMSKPMAAGVTIPELREAGVFHSVRQPIQASEIRQSLGFLWSAIHRDAAEMQEAGSSAADSKPTADSPASPRLEKSFSTSQ